LPGPFLASLPFFRFRAWSHPTVSTTGRLGPGLLPLARMVHPVDVQLHQDPGGKTVSSKGDQQTLVQGWSAIACSPTHLPASHLPMEAELATIASKGQATSETHWPD
jgi:hypothetical protein